MEKTEDEEISDNRYRCKICAEEFVYLFEVIRHIEVIHFKLSDEIEAEKEKKEL